MRYLFLIASLTLLFFNSNVNAQIKYSNDQLSINGGVNGNLFDISIAKVDRLKWTDRVNTHFFMVDLAVQNPRISGTGDCVVFYNSLTGKFNSIKVKEVFQSSDLRLKSNIKTLSSGLETIMNLRPVSFTWNNSIKNNTISTRLNSSIPNMEEEKSHYGFIAQEVEEVLPDIVQEEEDGTKLVNYSAMIPMLVQAIQEMQVTIENQNRKIEALSNQDRRGALSLNNKIISCQMSSSTELSVKTKVKDKYANAKLMITTLSGRKVKEFSLTKSSETFDIEDVHEGIYTITLLIDGQYADSARLYK